MERYQHVRDMVTTLQLEHHRTLADDCSVYLWPAKNNGSRYDHFVIIEEFSDGSASIYISMHGDHKAMRKLANYVGLLR